MLAPVSSSVRVQTTKLLRSAGRDPERDRSELFAIVYEDLRRVAGKLLAGERAGHTLQPTALVHEAWVRLVDEAEVPGDSIPEVRRRFVCLATRAMRNILIDHARRHLADKRSGAWHRVELTEGLAILECDATTVLDVESAFAEIEKLDPRMAQVAEMHVFGGMNVSEIAVALGLGSTTVKRDWNLARALLSRHLGASGGAAAES